MNTRREFIATAAGAALAAGQTSSYDIVVYGGSAAGAIAAVEGGRSGKRVVLIEPGMHIGGMVSGGLGATDYGRKDAIGGMTREFFERVRKYYADDAVWKYERRQNYSVHGHDWKDTAMWAFEPHVAEKIMRQMLAEAKVELVFKERLDLRNGVRKTGPRIDSIVMESGRSFVGRMFIDATYEGDVMAKAGVRYAVGRESNSQYGETQNGVQPRVWTRAGGSFGLSHFTRAVDPWVKPGDRSSGLLPGVHTAKLAPTGTGDGGVQAYNYRMTLTNVPMNRVPFERPKTYDPMLYELMRRLLRSGRRFPELPELDPEHPVQGTNPYSVIMPNLKTDTNNKGPVSSDYIGENWKYPDADHVTREMIIERHKEYHKGMLWYLAHDINVPEVYRRPLQDWGLAADEFTDTGNWPHQLYVREARRMIGEYVMTEYNCTGRDTVPDSVGLGSYGMDSHYIQRYVDEKGNVQCDGHMVAPIRQPYAIPYRSLIPKATEASNLLVPVCLSASHCAYGSIRMEPQYMLLGQSSAMAAVLAIDGKTSVQEVRYSDIRSRLEKAKQRLVWPIA